MELVCTTITTIILRHAKAEQTESFHNKQVQNM